VRYFLTALLIGVAVLGACTKPGATGVSVSSVFRPLIPADTKALAAVEIDRLKASQVFQRHQNLLNVPWLDAMSERVGLDPRRDISDLLVVWNGNQAVAMARERINRETLEAKLRSLGMQPTRYKNYTLFGEDREALTFMKHGVAVAGSTQTVRAEIDLESNGADVPDELQARLAIIPKTDQVWAVSRGGLALGEVPMRSDIESALSNIVGYVNATSLGIGFDTGTHLQAEIVCVSNEGAQRVHDALRGGVGLARLTTRDNESDLLKLYDAIQVSQDQQTVHLRADISGDLTDKLLAYLPQLRNRADQLLQR
jgi:hypothetical protein